MFLTKYEERVLDGEFGPALQLSMRILTKIGDALGASRLIRISSAHVSGISYKNIGDAGLQFLKHLRNLGARVSVLTTSNPSSFGPEISKIVKLPEDFIAKQMEVLRILEEMGILATYSCTPYYCGNVPNFSEHIAWAESSAVVFANSVLGARTNREGGPSSIAAAIVGKTPLYGLHIWENRLPTVLIKITCDLPDDPLFYSALGYLVGSLVKKGVPLFSGIKGCSSEALRCLAAGIATSGNIDMFHIEGATPEAIMHSNDDRFRLNIEEKISIDHEELKDIIEGNISESPDIVFLGCPHLSAREIISLPRIMPEIFEQKSAEVWICTSKCQKSILPAGFFQRLCSMYKNVKVFTDMCLVVFPVEFLECKSIATNSFKAYYYLRNTSEKEIGIFRPYRHKSYYNNHTRL
ncbi:MAG: aconitase X catalytic domain-containing protein [Candidatus Baldrarchaeia archaeon]